MQEGDQYSVLRGSEVAPTPPLSTPPRTGGPPRPPALRSAEGTFHAQCLVWSTTPPPHLTTSRQAPPSLRKRSRQHPPPLWGAEGRGQRKPLPPPSLPPPGLLGLMTLPGRPVGEGSRAGLHVGVGGGGRWEPQSSLGPCLGPPWPPLTLSWRRPPPPDPSPKSPLSSAPTPHFMTTLRERHSQARTRQGWGCAGWSLEPD